MSPKLNEAGVHALLGSPWSILRQDWVDDALCAEVGGDVHFPKQGEPTGPAKRICQRCEVRAECLQYALDFDERSGVWGGLSEGERREVKRLAALPTVEAA